MSAFSKLRPFTPLPELIDLKYNLWERGLEFEYLHAAEDTQRTRDEVFKILGQHMGDFRMDSIVIEKRKTNPVLQQNLGRFYKKALDILLKFLLQAYQGKFKEIFIITDLNLQIVDYLTWAIYRKWERADSRSYNLMKMCLRSEFEVFRSGTKTYY